MTTKSDRQRDEWPPERVRELRKRAGMTQAQLAHAIGVTPASVSQWESGANEISDVNRYKLARVLLDGDVPGTPDARITALEAEVRELRTQLRILQIAVAELDADVRPS